MVTRHREARPVLQAEGVLDTTRWWDATGARAGSSARPAARIRVADHQCSPRGRYRGWRSTTRRTALRRGGSGSSDRPLNRLRQTHDIFRVGQTTGRRTAWAGFTLLCLLTGAYALYFVIGGFADVPDEIASNDFLNPGGLRVHIAVTANAILVAPWQFARRLRDRHPRVHRTMGRIRLPMRVTREGTSRPS